MLSSSSSWLEKTLGSDGYVYGLNGDDNRYIFIPKLIQLYILNMYRVLHVSQTSMKWNKIFKLGNTSYNPRAIVRLLLPLLFMRIITINPHNILTRYVLLSLQIERLRLR